MVWPFNSGKKNNENTQSTSQQSQIQVPGSNTANIGSGTTGGQSQTNQKSGLKRILQRFGLFGGAATALAASGAVADHDIGPVTSTVGNIQNGLRQGAQNVANTAGSVAHNVQQWGTDRGHDAQQLGQKGATTTQDIAHNIQQWGTDRAHDAQQLATSVIHAGQQLGQNVANTAGSVAHNVEHFGAQTLHAGQQLGAQAVVTAQQVATSAIHAGQNPHNQITGLAAGLVAVATISAVHGVKHNKELKAMREELKNIAETVSTTHSNKPPIVIDSTLDESTGPGPTPSATSSGKASQAKHKGFMK